MCYTFYHTSNYPYRWIGGGLVISNLEIPRKKEEVKTQQTLELLPTRGNDLYVTSALPSINTSLKTRLL